MKKVKVSKEIAAALEKAIKVSGKEGLLNDHINIFNWSLECYLPLNELSNWKMAQILINGYEVEMKPEDNILHAFKMHNEDESYDRGWKNAVRHTLSELNIKIKGIND